jgi:hypothetical protein
MGQAQEIIDLCKDTDLDGKDTFWRRMRDRKYGTVIRIVNNRTLPKPIVPRVRSYGSGWIVLDTPEKRKEWLNL